MAKLYELPLKTLWIFNCNEADMAVDFQLKEGGKFYQVKGAGLDAFTPDGELKVCTTENLESIYFQNPNRTIYIHDGSVLKKIWQHWKKEGGQSRYDELFAQLEKYKQTQRQPLFTKNSNQEEPDAEGTGEITLTGKQIFNLVFEMEAILEMKKAFGGSISESEIELLISACTKGFDAVTIKNVAEALYKKLKNKSTTSMG